MESFGVFLVDYVQQAAASLTMFQKWSRLIWGFFSSRISEAACLCRFLLLTHLNFCHSEGWRGKLSNGLGSVQSEGVMTETPAGVPSATFLPFYHVFLTTSHLCSPALLCAGEMLLSCWIWKRAPFWAFFSLFCLIPFLLPPIPIMVPPFSTGKWLEKGLLISSKPRAYPTFWNINKGSF